MELRLHRNEENLYELRYNDIVLSQSLELSEVLGKAEKYAKKFCKKLFISKAALSDWYAGFPEDKDKVPEVFLDPFFPLHAGVTEAATSPYRFVEGPFMSQEDAIEAAFKIAGKQATVVEK